MQKRETDMIKEFIAEHVEMKKYLLRFGIILIIVLPIVGFFMGHQAIKNMVYKVCLVAIALGLAELLWVFFFKTVFSRVEDLSEGDKRTVLLFRGILYAAIILALCLGL
jgi:RsiW-degrading membrane proteinase PrsW (M82 family)